MKKIWKRVISITLCFVMVFGLIGTSIPAAKAADPEELLVVDGVGGIRWDAPGALIKITGTVTIYERKYVTQDNNGDGFISQGEYEVTNTILATKEVTIRSTSNRFYDSVAEGWNLVDISSSNITPNLTLTSDGHIQNPSVMRPASSGFTINLYFSHKCQCGDPDCTCPGGCDCRPGCTCYNWIEGGKGCAGSVRTVNINAYQNYRYDSAWTTDSDGEGNYTHEAGYAYEYCLPYDVVIPRVSSDYSCFTNSGHVVRVSWDDPNSDISWATFYDSETTLGITSVPAISLPVDIELTFTPLFKDNSTYVMGWSNTNLADDNLTYFDKVRDYPEQHGLGPAGRTTSNGSEALISLDRNLTAIIESYGQIALTLYLDWTKIADHSSEWVTASYQLAGDDTGAKLSGTQYHYVHKNGSTVTNGSTGVSNDSTTPSSDSDGSVLTSKSFTPPSVTLSDNNVFRFDGWYFDSSYTNPYKLTQLRNYTGNNFTLYGKITRTGYYITSTAQNGTITPNGKQVYSIGSDQTFTYQPNDGYVIDYVMVDGTKFEKQYEAGAEYQSSYTFSNVQQDHTIEAVFALDANGNEIPDYVEGHSLVYDANGGMDAPTDAGKHLSGDEVTLADGSGMTHAAQGETDVVFIGWTAQEDGKIYAKGDTAPATLTKVTFENADITVYAVWGLDSNGDGIADVTQTWHTITAKFTLLHFKGLHRDMTSGVIESEIANCEVEVIEVTNDGAHLSFEIGSAGFSPFGLVWQKTSSPSHPSEPTETPHEEELIYTPNWLNTEDHKAYITGYASGEIKPENHITRAEVAMIFYRLLTDEARERFAGETNPYSDVKKGDWYYAAVSTLSNMGILNGYNDGTFRPNNTITRAEFAKIAVCFYDYRNIQATNNFVDVKDGAWYENYVAIAAEIGLIEGYSNHTFRPNNSITRAETCTIVNRMLHRAPHMDYLLPTDEMAIWPDNPKNAWYYVQMQEASVSHNYIMQNGHEVWIK